MAMDGSPNVVIEVVDDEEIKKTIIVVVMQFAKGRRAVEAWPSKLR